MADKWAIVTGSSTGIGRAIVQRLAELGVNVLAGVRKEADGQRLASEATGKAGKVVPVQLDVTDPAQIARAVDQAAGLTGDAGLWALVNNAGIVVPGPIEFLTLDDWRRQFDVNFFGMCEMTRVSLPLVRKAVASFGRNVPRIMLVSSIGGRVAQPIVAPYTCSKFATTALGDSLRLELRRQGIGVTILEPGAIATEIWGKGDQAGSAFGEGHPARQFYAAEIDGLMNAAKQASQNALPAADAAKIAVGALLAKRAPARVLVGRDAQFAALFRKWMPLSVFDSILMRQFQVKA